MGQPDPQALGVQGMRDEATSGNTLLLPEPSEKAAPAGHKITSASFTHSFSRHAQSLPRWEGN
jgi:hypothetical protein